MRSGSQLSDIRPAPGRASRPASTAGAARPGPKSAPAGLQLPDVNGPGSITAVSLTGSRQPDFLITGSGADWQPASVVSDTGGSWHAVLFDYGTGLTTLVDEGRTQGALVETRVNACGCASGPESYLWEAYSDGAFRPANPPGPRPSCTASSLTWALEEMGPLGGSPPLTFKKAACADGWALAAGTGDAYTGPLIGLFEQLGGRCGIDLQLDRRCRSRARSWGFTTSPFRCSSGLVPSWGPALPPKSARPGPQANWGFRPVPP